MMIAASALAGCADTAGTAEDREAVVATIERMETAWGSYDYGTIRQLMPPTATLIERGPPLARDSSIAEFESSTEEQGVSITYEVPDIRKVKIDGDVAWATYILGARFELPRPLTPADSARLRRNNPADDPYRRIHHARFAETVVLNRVDASWQVVHLHVSRIVE